MEYTTHFDETRSLLTMKVSGKIDVAEVLAIGPRFLAEHPVKGHLYLLLDYRDIELAEFSTPDVRDIVTQDSKIWTDIDKFRCALVASSDVVFGMARMFATLSGRPGAMVSAFRTMEDAETWLLKDDRE